MNKSTAIPEGRAIMCDGCKREKNITLVTGDTCCSWCERWSNECEARHLISLPRDEIKPALEARKKERGKIDALEAAMRALWEHKHPLK